MNNHKNARLAVHGRALHVRRVLEEGLRPIEVAQAMGVSARTVYKWVRRYREEGTESSNTNDQIQAAGRLPTNIHPPSRSQAWPDIALRQLLVNTSSTV